MSIVLIVSFFLIAFCTFMALKSLSKERDSTWRDIDKNLEEIRAAQEKDLQTLEEINEILNRMIKSFY